MAAGWDCAERARCIWMARPCAPARLRYRRSVRRRLRRSRGCRRTTRIRCNWRGSPSRCRSAGTASADRLCRRPRCWRRLRIRRTIRSSRRWWGTYAGVGCISGFARPFIARVDRAPVLIGVRFSGLLVRAQESDPGAKQKAPNPFVAYVHVKPDGNISLIVAKSEMGQGIKTGLAMVLAEEAEVDFASVKVEQAETRPDLYAHMGTGGSGSTMENFTPLRRAGATVRELMITAAAAKWNVPASECEAKSGTVLHAKSSRKAGYGELVEAAEKLP